MQIGAPEVPRFGQRLRRPLLNSGAFGDGLGAKEPTLTRGLASVVAPIHGPRSHMQITFSPCDAAHASQLSGHAGRMSANMTPPITARRPFCRLSTTIVTLTPGQ
eukprot:15459629-Alexandrium_andersonii.AAC.1